MRWARRAGLLLALATLACGSDFSPPALETTGVPAAPVGQVIDVEAALPGLQIQGAQFRGVGMALRIEMAEGDAGEIPARVVFGPARVDQRFAEVEDLTDGQITVMVGDGSWTTSRIGPLRIENTPFEMLLDGERTDDGWQISGRSWESQSGLTGDFVAWRQHRFLVAGTDFFSSAGRVAEVSWEKEDEVVVRERLELVSSDPQLRHAGGAVFAVNRLTFDNLQRLDPFADFVTAWQASVGVGSNPHDALAVSEEKGYVTRYEPPFDDVAVFDPQSGAILASIPLGELAENPDGTPRADRMALADGKLFVGLQDIDRTFSRYAEGKLAVIDTATDELIGVIPLGGKNPGALEVHVGDDGRTRLYVALAGVFPGLNAQELSGGVVVVDVVNQVVERVALDDDVAGGNIGGLAVAHDRLAYAVVSDASFRNRVIAFDPSTGDVLRTVREGNELIPEIEIDSRGILAVPDRHPVDQGLCLYRTPADPATPETFIWCRATELPPFSITALD